MKIRVINGPNLNLLGKRENLFYGTKTLQEIEMMLRQEFPDIEIEFYQSNLEGEIVELIQSSAECSGILINPGGYAHTSVAIKDALEVVKIPKVEVHLSNLTVREGFRQTLITASSCDGYLSGFKEISYSGGMYILLKLIKKKDKVD
jgi:3-dehydroquinate dehydratase II